MNQRFCRLILSGMLAAGLTLCSAAAFAQDEDAPPPANGSAQGPGGGGRRGAQMTPDQELAQMTMRYNLSADQQTQLKPILEARSQQMMALRQDSSLSREDRMAKMQSIRTDSTPKIEAVLNDQQKQQYEADQQRMQQRQGGQGGRGAGGGGGEPPAQ